MKYSGVLTSLFSTGLNVSDECAAMIVECTEEWGGDNDYTRDITWDNNTFKFVPKCI